MNTVDQMVEAELVLRSGIVDPLMWQGPPLSIKNISDAARLALRTLKAWKEEDLIRWSEADNLPLATRMCFAFMKLRQYFDVYDFDFLDVKREAPEVLAPEVIRRSAAEYVERHSRRPDRIIVLHYYNGQFHNEPRHRAPAPAAVQQKWLLCLDCGVATNKKATWRCGQCKCGAVVCGTCAMQRKHSESGWSRCPKCDAWAKTFKRVSAHGQPIIA